MENTTNEFVIRTKRAAQYFRGRLYKNDIGNDKYTWRVTCIAYAGGGRKVSILSILDIERLTRSQIITALHAFARRNKYLISFSSKDF